MAQISRRFRRRRPCHDLDALLEDDLALVVHHVVVFQDLLAHIEVARLDLLLRHFQRLVHPAVRDRLALLQAELAEHAVHLVRAEDAHQVVFERQVELRPARDRPDDRNGRAAGCRCAGSRGARCRSRRDRRPQAPCACFAGDVVPRSRARLAAISPFRRFAALARASSSMPVAQPEFDVAAKLNVGAAAGHVGRDRHRAGHAGLGDDLGFLLVIARVEHLVLDQRLAGLRLLAPARRDARRCFRRCAWYSASFGDLKVSACARILLPRSPMYFLSFSSSDSYSDFSIDAVPTSTGWPRRTASDDLHR